MVNHEPLLFSPETMPLSPEALAAKSYEEAPGLYRLFVAVCERRRQQQIDAGRSRVRLSARDVLGRMRDEPAGPGADGRGMGDSFKINNWLSRPFAERLSRERPVEFGDAFVSRKSGGS